MSRRFRLRNDCAGDSTPLPEASGRISGKRSRRRFASRIGIAFAKPIAYRFLSAAGERGVGRGPAASSTS